MLAHVRCNGTDAGAEQVRLGMAWVFVRYAPADPPLYAIEEEARAARPGYGLSVSQCRRGSHVSANGGRLRATKRSSRHPIELPVGLGFRSRPVLNRGCEDRCSMSLTLSRSKPGCGADLIRDQTSSQIQALLLGC